MPKSTIYTVVSNLSKHFGRMRTGEFNSNFQRISSPMDSEPVTVDDSDVLSEVVAHDVAPLAAAPPEQGRQGMVTVEEEPPEAAEKTAEALAPSERGEQKVISWEC